MYSRIFSLFSTSNENITNKNSFTPTPITQQKLEELAAIANFIYTPTSGWNMPDDWYMYHPFCPEDWEREHGVGSSHGYMGAILMRYGEDGCRPAEIAIVHRGTILSNSDNVIACLEIALNQVPKQVQVAAAWLDINLEIWRRRPDNFGDNVDLVPTWHLGHSLGAIIANCTFVREYPNHLSNPGRHQCVGFENPGANEIVMNYLRSLQLSDTEALDRMRKLGTFAHAYQADVNIINTCNKQWGKVNHVKIPYRYEFDKTTMPDKVPGNYLVNLYYVRKYSFDDQHEMKNLLTHILQKVAVVDANERKEGFNNGYLQYLDGEKRKEYWLGYFQILWNKNPEIQWVFHNKFSAYAQFMFNELHDMRRQSLLQDDTKSNLKTPLFNSEKVIPIDKNSAIVKQEKDHDEHKDFVVISKEEAKLSIR